MKKVVIFESDLSYDFNLEMWVKYLNLLNTNLESKNKYKIIFYCYDDDKILSYSEFILLKKDLEYVQVLIVPVDTVLDQNLVATLESDIPEHFICIHNILKNREDALLIKVIEECDLGQYNDFKVIEVPKDLEYYIGSLGDDCNVEVIIQVHQIYTSNGVTWVGK